MFLYAIHIYHVCCYLVSKIGSLKILSANCRGLGDVNKRKDVFDYLRRKNYSIYCIQDTHFTENTHQIVRSQWGFECFSSYGTSNSRGV